MAKIGKKGTASSKTTKIGLSTKKSIADCAQKEAKITARELKRIEKNKNPFPIGVNSFLSAHATSRKTQTKNPAQ